MSKESRVYVCERCMKPALAWSNPLAGVRIAFEDRCGVCIGPERKDALTAEGACFDRLFHPACPPLFVKTNPALLPDRLRATAEKWLPGDKSSLLLHGTTGTGKTRAAWCIVNRLWGEHAKAGKRYDLEFHTMRSLSDALTGSFQDKPARGMGHEALMNHLISCNLLVLDDLGKEKMTPRLAADLFSLIDERANHERTTIMTTNFNGPGLVSRFDDPEMGAAVVRRLRDYYEAKSA